jgi:hypothetical protein
MVLSFGSPLKVLWLASSVRICRFVSLRETQIDGTGTRTVVSRLFSYFRPLILMRNLIGNAAKRGNVMYGRGLVKANRVVRAVAVTRGFVTGLCKKRCHLLKHTSWVSYAKRNARAR